MSIGGAGKRSTVEYCNESRFLGEYPCGGHAGLGHHRRAVGDQDLLRHVGTGWRCCRGHGPQSIRGSRQKLPSAAAEDPVLSCCTLCLRVCIAGACSAPGTRCAVASVFRQTPDRCRKDSTSFPHHLVLLKIIDVESNAAQNDHLDDITHAC